MTTLGKPIIESLKFSDFIIQITTSDLTDAIARRRIRTSAGPSISWIVGHLMHYRHQMLNVIGQPQPNPYDRLGTAGATHGSDYPATHEMSADWRHLAPSVLGAISATNQDQFLENPAVAVQGEKTVLDVLILYMWHETYHMGRLGTLRTQFGLKPTATSRARRRPQLDADGKQGPSGRSGPLSNRAS